MSAGALLRRFILAPSAIAALAVQVPTAICGDSSDPDAPKKVCKKKKQESDCEPPELEKCIAKCRKEFGPVKGAMEEYADQAGEFAKASCRVIMRNVIYLQKCAPEEVRFGAIAGAGLFGVILAYRKSFIKKLLFGVLGAGTMAAIIYPKEAKDLATQTYFMGKKGIMDIYNKVGDVSSTPEKKVCRKKRVCPPKEE